MEWLWNAVPGVTAPVCHAPLWKEAMKKTALVIRCVPRYGYANTEVRAIDLGVSRRAPEPELRQALYFYFAARGITDAVYDIDVDEDGYFAVINDEAYQIPWGEPML